MAAYDEIVLPDNQVLRRRLREVDRLVGDQLEEAKDFLFETADNFEDVVQSYSDLGEAMDDPEIVADNIERYRIYSGALVGLSVALYEKAKASSYQDLINENIKDPKNKTVQSDRDILVRGRTASLKGLMERIKRHDTVLTSRAIRQGMGAGKGQKYQD